MTSDVTLCKGNAKLDEVARLMVEHNCGAIPVVDDTKTKRIIGILTDRDIVSRTLAVGKDPKDLTASACMTTEVFTCSQDSDIEECLAAMEQHHVRRIPIVDDKNGCCGIVTLRHLASVLPASDFGEAVREVTSQSFDAVPTTKKDAPYGATTRESTRKKEMPYRNLEELPKGVKDNLPKHAKEIYMSAYNSAAEDYSDPSKRRDSTEDLEEVAAKVAWAAVKQEYEKKGDKWVAKKSTANR
jgi:CBS domain-containing protein/cation transport regulator ChaB